MRLGDISVSAGVALIVFDLMYAMLSCPDGINKEMFSFLVSVYLIGLTIAIIGTAAKIADRS